LGCFQFLSKEIFAGAVGYFFNRITGGSGPGAKLGSFRSPGVGIALRSDIWFRSAICKDLSG